MSRLGKMPILIPTGVTLEIKDSDIKVKGPKGELSIVVRPEVDVRVEGANVIVSPKDEGKNTFAYWGMTRSILSNLIEGVSKGFEKKLELVGVGFRAKSTGPTNLSLTLGFSHPVDIKAPEGIQFEVVDNVNVFIRGINKELVGQVAANIRKIRKPEPYKGKGIKYLGEVVRRKAGKAGKTAAK